MTSTDTSAERTDGAIGSSEPGHERHGTSSRAWDGSSPPSALRTWISVASVSVEGGNGAPKVTTTVSPGSTEARLC